MTSSTPSQMPADGTGTGADLRAGRWRLLLGEAAAETLDAALDPDQERMDRALAALYDADSESHGERPGSGTPGRPRRGGLGGSAPRVARWLGDIRSYFPTSVVQVMQRDAVERLQLTSMLLEPELLSAVQPDVHLVGTLISLQAVMPETTRTTARAVVARVVADIEQRIAQRTRSAATGALRRSERTRRPRPGDIDWGATIAQNLRHYQPEFGTVIPERLVGRSRGTPILSREVVVAVDQSGSMAESVVYAAVFAATLASLRALRTTVVAFDTDVVDLTDRISDPVDLLFACQLGGGTDIERAVRYCAQQISRPEDALLVLITDLFDGGARGALTRRVAALVASGVSVLVLLALSDSGTPAYDHTQAAELAALGVPVFACSPDRFPDLLAVALSRGDLAAAVAAMSAEEAARAPEDAVRGSAL